MPIHADFPIITKLGGRDAVYEHLRQVAGITTKATIRMWHQRRAIPPRQRLHLMELADSKGLSYVGSDFQLTNGSEQSVTPQR